MTEDYLGSHYARQATYGNGPNQLDESAVLSAPPIEGVLARAFIKLDAVSQYPECSRHAVSDSDRTDPYLCNEAASAPPSRQPNQPLRVASIPTVMIQVQGQQATGVSVNC